MSLSITRIQTPQAFDDFADSTLSAGDSPADSAPSTLLFLVFFGSEVAETGESWCPDCVMADPVIRGTLARITARPVHLVECPVGDRSAYKGQSAHPYRTDARVRLVRIPTLIRFEGGREVGRLTEAECLDPDAILRLAASG